MENVESDFPLRCELNVTTQRKNGDVRTIPIAAGAVLFEGIAYAAVESDIAELDRCEQKRCCKGDLCCVGVCFSTGEGNCSATGDAPTLAQLVS